MRWKLTDGFPTNESSDLKGMCFLYVSHPDVVVGWIIEARMRGCGGNDRRQMRRQLFRGRPLVKSRVRPAPHGNFAVAKRLFC